ncbi:MAG: radical SAM family heme chaperone HemW [Shimia sp.]
MPAPPVEGGFGVYVHWPFCAAKCPYCDFNSHVVGRVDQEAWRSALVSEVARYARETEGEIVRSIYFGGGTPSLMPEATVAAVIEAIRRAWRWENDVEITLEANPTSADAGRFAGYRAAGVNRLSLGVQALHDADLRRLGRMHDADEARRAIDLAQRTFDRMSFDLIYARQDQGPDAWAAELREAIGFGTGHLSLYQLTVEPGTVFAAREAAGHLRGMPGEDLSVELWEITQEMTAAAGLQPYEVSNHAADGAMSRHNLIYWGGGAYVGVGPGAHGRLGREPERVATETALAPAAFLDRVALQGDGEVTRSPLDAGEARIEGLLMGLRTASGMSRARLARLGLEVGGPSQWDLKAQGLIDWDDGALWVTEAGRPLLNAVLTQLVD